MKLEVEHGYIFDKTDQAYLDGKKVIVHQGGTGSGKTYDIIVWLIFAYALKKPNQIITVVSESMPHLKVVAIRIFKEIMTNAGIYDSNRYNKTDAVYSFHNGTIIEFFSADRISKALGARRDVLFANEVNNIKFEIYDELARRSELNLSDFNPTAEFWMDKIVAYYEDVIIIKSNCIDNPFLPATERKRIMRRAELDVNFRRVHIDCEYGTTEGLIFPHFDVIDEFPNDCKIVMYGLDFGYSNDPTALVKVGIQGERIYLEECIYETGLTNQDIVAKMQTLGIPRSTEIFADSAEPKSIEEIHRGRVNIKPAMKGADSIKHGINLILQHKLFVTKKSVHLIKELRNYTWAKDKMGETLNKPIDDYNHAIDAMRYAIQTKLARRDGRVVKVGFPQR